MNNSKQAFLGVIVALILIFVLLNALVLSGRVSAEDEALDFLPVILSYAPIQPPATKMPTSTPQATTTLEPTATSTSTTTPAATMTSTATSTPTSTAVVTATNTPAITPTSGPTNTPEPGAQILVYDWNKLVTVDQSGFPRIRPPIENGDWTYPVNYVMGTMYFRVEIHEQPVPQSMLLQYCIWQEKPEGGFRETCGPKKRVEGQQGNIMTWSGDIEDFWKKGGEPIDWTLPRRDDGVPIKNLDDCPVSNINISPSSVPNCPIGEDGYMLDWAGEDPAEWYPLDMRFSVAAVPSGQIFVGWDVILK